MPDTPQPSRYPENAAEPKTAGRLMTSASASAMKKISTEQAPHYKWGNNCDGWHLLRAEHLSVIQERMPPGTSEVPHYHDRAHQFFYILSGELRIELEGDVHKLQAKQGLEIRPKSKHRVYNSSASEALFLVVSSPPSHGDRIQIGEPGAPG